MNPIAVRRLYRQGLVQPMFETSAEVVAWLGAVQAQDYPGTLWSLGLRMPGAAQGAVEQAIHERTFLRTWTLRGTLHFVAAADLRWMLDLVVPRLLANNARRYRELALDDGTLNRSNDILANAVAGGKRLSRPELFAILQQGGISTEGQRGVWMLQHASQHKLLCQGVQERNQPTFMLMDEAVPDTRTLTRAEGAAELARRYFTSHGPATLQDFVWWSGLAVGEARAALDAVQAGLVSETVDGVVYWGSPHPPAPSPEWRGGADQMYSSPQVILMPGFDEFLVSYKDRSASLAKEHVPLWNKGNAVYSPTVVRDGQVIGMWKRPQKKGKVALEAELFVTLNEAERAAFAKAAEAYGAFLGLPVVVPEEI